MRDAYDHLQSYTLTKHRQINEAIVGVLTGPLGIDIPSPAFEYRPFADRELRIDLHAVRGERPDAIEFTYRRGTDASAAVVSSYALSKIQDYARDYGLT